MEFHEQFKDMSPLEILKIEVRILAYILITIYYILYI